MSQLTPATPHAASRTAALWGAMSALVILGIVLALATAMGVRIEVQYPWTDAAGQVVVEQVAPRAAQPAPLAVQTAQPEAPTLQDRLDSEYLRSISADWGAASAGTPTLQDRLDSEYLRSISADWGQ
jgi:hypothetical protein